MLRAVTLALALAVPVAAQVCPGTTTTVAQVQASLSEKLTPPASLEAYKVKMGAWPTEASIKDARATTKSVRDFYSPRKGYAKMDDASTPTDTIDVSARLCGLKYDECTENGVAGVMDGFGCAAAQPLVGQNCTTSQMEAYGASLAIPALLPVAFGVLFFVILIPLWYFPRCCCKCFGGRKPGKGKCCCFSMCVDYEDKPNYAKGDTLAKCNQINVLRVLNGISLLACGAALVIGFLGNTKVDDGMRGSVDATLYEMKNLLKVANSAMSQMNAIMATAPGDAAVSSTALVTTQICMMNSLKTTIDGFDKDVEDMDKILFDYRKLGTLIAVVAPAGLTAIVFLFSMVRKCGAIVCLSALLMVIVGFISAISGGAHLALALLTGDLCYEMDMHLYQYDYLQATKNASESISFLPADTVPCGSTGELAFLSTELNSNLDKAMGGACGAVVALCNDNNNFAKYWLDCSAITMKTPTSTVWTGANDGFSDSNPPYAKGAPSMATATAEGSAATYTTSVAGSENCKLTTKFGDVSSEMKFMDVPATAGLGTFDNPMKSCLHKKPAAYLAAAGTNWNTAGTHQGYSGEFSSFNLAALPSNAAIKAALIANCWGLTSNKKTAAVCAANCANAEVKSGASQLQTTLTSQVSTFTSLNTLMSGTVNPLLSCQWISDIYRALYMPLCVEASPGLTLIFLSQLIGCVALVIAFFSAVLITKRLPQGKADKGDLDSGYGGLTGHSTAYV